MKSDPQDKRLTKVQPYIRYNQFGTKTGRLSTRSSSFPILTLPKKHRSIVDPTNDYFIELDFNGAEVRVLLGLLGKTQPTGDVHEFHSREVFGGSKSRDEVKVAFFAWLYGSKSAEVLPFATTLESFYNKDEVLDRYWDGKRVYTPYRKTIDNVGEHHALNYIIQSTCAELTLLQALKIKHFLESRQSSTYISSLIHDAIVLDVSHAELPLLKDIKKLMESTRFGTFKVTTTQGPNLGDMREMG
jgi:DNA polymerase I-like protein with 3'-5' exonuclease and polymerase domains